MPPDVTQIVNQGVVTGTGVPGVLSDDPDTLHMTDPTRTPLGTRPVLVAVKRDTLATDADPAGVSAGDTLRYAVTLQNAGTGAATSVVFTDTPGPGTTLMVGSVSSSTGTVQQGNTPGDTAVTVAVDALAPGALVTINFGV